MSEDSVGRASVSGVFMPTRARTGQLRRGGKSFGLKTGLELRICKTPVSVLIRFRIENENSRSGM